MLTILINAFEETFLMVLIASVFTVVLGLPLGFLLYGTTNKQFFQNKTLHYAVRLPITFLHSSPYLMIVIFSLPLIKSFVDNHTINSTAAILPLTLAAIPLYSLLTFEAIQKLPKELSETVKAIGATPWQAIMKIYLPEILPALVQAIAKILIHLISLSTIAGLLGAGGVGALIMQKGYYSFESNYIVACALLLVCSTQLIQFSSHLLAKQIAKH